MLVVWKLPCTIFLDGSQYFFDSCLSPFYLRWCYTGQLATPTCNADSQRMFFAQICRHATLLNRFQNLATRCSTANIAKNRPQRGVTLDRFFAQHRIVASWRCKLTSVTPPLHSPAITRTRPTVKIETQGFTLHFQGQKVHSPNLLIRNV